MNDPIEHATGIEKFELMAKKAGNDVSTSLRPLGDDQIKSTKKIIVVYIQNTKNQP